MTGAWAKATAVAAIRQRYPDFTVSLPVLDPFLKINAPALSYTQWEAWLALYHNKVLIIATPQDGAPRDERYLLEECQRTAQYAHLERLRKVGRYPEIHFANADRLAVDMLRSKLHDILDLAGSVNQQPQQRVLYVGGAGLVILVLIGSAYSLQDAAPTETATLAEKIYQPDPNEAISQTLTGIFKDSMNNRPLAGVIVALSEFRKTAITDEFGGFEITINVPRRHMVELTAHKEGFEDLTKNVGFSTAKQEFILKRR